MLVENPFNHIFSTFRIVFSSGLPMDLVETSKLPVIILTVENFNIILKLLKLTIEEF
jgi:hypothetical protein